MENLTILSLIPAKMNRLRAPNATEALFSPNFELLISIMFEGHNISVVSGETVSDATSRAVAANDSCYNTRNEYCCMEFKRQDATTGLLTCQQSKSNPYQWRDSESQNKCR
ncbi:hypothetical protein HPULCUR_002293 [Helicostylum pulchrum]|uniref:Uncharacterized protein n=1 Tax=Helicostylum pulchrum TaxID=562976 RepID=A0ABP9XRC4_9FUNG